MSDIKEINIGRHINLAMITGYKENKQLIFGITTTFENEYFSNNIPYGDVAFKRRKFELNLWLFSISLHITICGNKNKVGE